ncbi:MAG TPA: hypothetical protein VFA32_05035, partial [Dehalococcoidia bacterium]|nr:hypothetical protein [Dehalococcoidia bacterium]
SPLMSVTRCIWLFLTSYNSEVMVALLNSTRTRRSKCNFQGLGAFTHWVPRLSKLTMQLGNLPLLLSH